MESNATEAEWENFCYNMRWLRKKYGLSKREMAKRLGIGTRSLNKLENGEMPPRLGVEIFFRLRDSFGVRIGDQLKARLDDASMENKK